MTIYDREQNGSEDKRYKKKNKQRKNIVPGRRSEVARNNRDKN